jgi:hypothetical protein
MSVFYTDTSVLLKQHVNEPGDLWFRAIVVSLDAVIMTTELSIVEVYSAFNRLLQMSSILHVNCLSDILCGHMMRST